MKQDTITHREPLVVDGTSLSIEKIWRVVHTSDTKVTLDEHALKRIDEARNFLEREIAGKVVYGINTGFGPMSSHVIGNAQLQALQYNLIRSHAVGIGNPIDSRYVLAAMIIRLNTFATGYSGASSALARALASCINSRVIPIVPEHGAVGTSGDLVQLAHIALALIGEGEVEYQSTRMPTRQAFLGAALTPYDLKPKEGLTLINGTSMMTGIGALTCAEAQRLITFAIRMSAWSLELVGGYQDGISEKLHAVRPHAGQGHVAKQLRAHVESSSLMQDREKLTLSDDMFASGEHEGVPLEVHELPDGIQEIYSLRCVPQIIGPIYDAVTQTAHTLETEMNATTDNPIVDWEHGAFLHGGNFHGDYVSFAMDIMKIAMVKLTVLMERQINFFLNRNVNKHFPPFLNLKTPGLTLALQGLQFVATSTTAQSQTLAFPQYVHSITTNADNQDVVSMGTDATLLAARVVENAYTVAAIEMLTLAQATDVLGVYDAMSVSSKALFDAIRGRFPKIQDDRDTTGELNRFVQFVRNELPE